METTNLVLQILLWNIFCFSLKFQNDFSDINLSQDLVCKLLSGIRQWIPLFWISKKSSNAMEIVE